MNDKDYKRHLAHDALMILIALAIFLFICRLWPILLLVILGIFIAALRLAFLASTKVDPIEPAAPLPASVPRRPTERDVQELAFGLIQERVTELVKEQYPQARWVWKSAQAKSRILVGEEVSILLNRAGGYREAVVQIRNLQVMGLRYLQAAIEEKPVLEIPERDEEDTPDCPDVSETEKPDSQKSALDKTVGSEAEESPSLPNYELLAFEWVEAHAVDLNERCNECIAHGLTVCLISAEELPGSESWQAICNELGHNGIEDCVPTDAGIEINLTQ